MAKTQTRLLMEEASKLASLNPILLEGQIVIAKNLDNNYITVGDGITHYNDLESQLLNTNTPSTPPSSGDDLINRPDKWVTGTEYDFGDGLYGRRFIGSINTPTSSDDLNSGSLSLVSSPNIDLKLLDYGGWIANTATDMYPRKKIMLGAFDNIEYPSLASSLWILDPPYRMVVIMVQSRNVSPSLSPIDFDIWIKYTKN
jgi:hypothetical protein